MTYQFGGRSPYGTQGYGTTAFQFSGPITTQGEITRNLTVNPAEFKQRVTNASTNPDMVYPGGSDEANLKVDKGGLLFSWTTPKHAAQRRVGQSQIEIFQSFNGLFHGDVEGEDELNDKMWFAGVNKVDYMPLSSQEIPNGVAAIGFGSTTIAYTGNVDVYPGDELVWEVPPIHTKTTEYAPPRFTGQPATKLTAIIKPLDWKDLEYQVSDTFYTMITRGDKGVLDRHINELKNFTIKRSRKKTAALAMKKHIIMTAMRSIESLVNRGIIVINTPEKDQRDFNMKKLINVILNTLDLNLGSPLQQKTLQDIRTVFGRGNNLQDIATAISTYINDEMNVQETNASAQPMPTGMTYLQHDPILGRNIQGPQFTREATFFKSGFQWGLQTSILTGGGAGTGEFVPKEILKILLRKREDNILWLAHVLGATGTRKTTQSKVVLDMLKYVGFNYLLPGERLIYEPNITKGDIMTNRLKNKSASDYFFNTSTQWFDFEGTMAHHRHGITRRKFAVAGSFGTPGLDQKIDVVIK